MMNPKKSKDGGYKKLSNGNSNNGSTPIVPLETLLGYKFNDKNLLLKALTPNQLGERLFEDRFNYQVLEFQVRPFSLDSYSLRGY